MTLRIDDGSEQMLAGHLSDVMQVANFSGRGLAAQHEL